VSDRAVSTVLGYTLTLGISSLLIIGLLVATGGFASDHRHQTIRDELQVLGQQLASDLSAADRLVRGGDDSEVEIRRQLPQKVTGLFYRITVDGSGQTVTLSTENPDVSVEVPVVSETSLGDTTINGGPIVIVYDSGNMEVRDD